MHLFPNNCQHINSHIFAELHPPVFASPTQSERWWINKSWREPRPFQVIFLQTAKLSFGETLNIRSFSSSVWEIVTLAVSEWKTSSAANRVCMLVTRKRIRLSCNAGNSSWSSEFWVLGQWFLRWHYWLLLAIIFILFTWVEDLVGPLCIFHALLKVSCCLSKIFMHWRKNLMWTLLGRSHKYHILRSSNPSYSYLLLQQIPLF